MEHMTATTTVTRFRYFSAVAINTGQVPAEYKHAAELALQTTGIERVDFETYGFQFAVSVPVGTFEVEL